VSNDYQKSKKGTTATMYIILPSLHTYYLPIFSDQSDGKQRDMYGSFTSSVYLQGVSLALTFPSLSLGSPSMLDTLIFLGI